jgi:hypothetical protein
VNDIYKPDYRIDSSRTKELSIEVDNLTFFKNNEYNSSFQKGYTLPGFWLQLKSVYQPFNNLKVEAGAHSLWFWGANRYPAYTYRGLASREESEKLQNVHVLPFLRANIAFSKHLNFVMGNIYGGASHKLIEPLYNPELNLSSDPETGIQLLFDSKFFDFDLWIDWQTFIFNNDTHQEAFVSGFSAVVKANDEHSKFHVYFPVQNLIHHRGGEIDTISGVYTTLNTAIGAGVRYNANAKLLKNINLEFDYLYNKNPKETENKFGNGKGYYGKLAFQLKNFNVSTSYWKSDDFISLFGNPFYGIISYKQKGMFFKNLSMLKFETEYTYPLGKGFDFGINTSVFYFLTGYMYSDESPERYPFQLENNRNFSFGIYLRMNPAFLMKKF